MTVKLYAFCFTSRTSAACSSSVRSRFGILEIWDHGHYGRHYTMGF